MNLYLFIDGTVVVRPEEALIVLFVLVLWIGAIGLFFHRYAESVIFKNHLFEKWIEILMSIINIIHFKIL